MTNPTRNARNDDIPLADLFRPLIQYRRLIWQGTLGITIITGLLGALYFVFQPTAWSATIGFRPVFKGADDGSYPNGLPFAPTDVTDTSIVTQVYEKNNLKEHCSISAFRSGFVVATASPSLQFLTLEYAARLSDLRLSVIDRQRIQDEFTTRKTTASREYQLLFVRPSECASIPQAVMIKAMDEVLEEWARDSQERRGVLKARVAVLTPAIFDETNSFQGSMLVRADLVRAAMTRVIGNIDVAEKIQGAELVRIGDQQIGLAEVRVRLEDLKTARLDPLIGLAGRGLGRESVQWVTRALETASAQLKAAQSRTEAYQRALREYSGVALAPPSSTSALGDKPTSSDVQALTPQIDRTFIEGIVALSAANTAFRQEITRNMIDASIEAVFRSQTVDYYRALLAAMKEPMGESLSPDEVAKRLEAITAQAKEATRQFNQIYDEFSRMAFRPGPLLYQVQQPAQVTVLRAFRLRDFAFLLLGVFLAAPIVLAVACLVLFHVRRFVMSALPASA